MTNIFYNNIFKELNKKQIFSFDDIQQFQKNITDICIKENVTNYFNWFKDNYKTLEYFYNLLENNLEKKLYIKMILTKLFGIQNISNKEKEEHIRSRDKFDNLLVDNSVIKLKSVTRKLKFYDLSKLGYDIKLYGARALLDKLVTHKQYFYKDCKIKKDDFVIDAGGCWADTALIFSSTVGEKGKIFSFEFFEDNLNIFKKNISYNKELANRIILTEQPLYDKSNKTLYLNHACADITTLTEKENKEQQYITISIDDFIKDKKIKKLDFIKMDVEGSELKVLQGAKNSLIKYKPKLAIASYHRYDDYYKIPKFLNELGIGYKFYFANYTLGFTDTIIYAI